MKNIFRLSVIFASIALLFGCEQTVFDLYMAGPTNVTCKSSSSTPTSLTVTLSQSESADNPVMQYTVQLLNTTKDNPSEEDTTVTKTFSPGTSITFTNLTTGKCYYARVRVIYTMGRSEWVVSSNRVKVGKGTVGASESDDSTPNNNQIFYSTTDGKPISLPETRAALEAFNGVKLVSNTYDSSVSRGILTFNSNVDYIGFNAFNGLSNLRVIELPEGIETIEVNSFTGCNNLWNFLGGNDYAAKVSDNHQFLSSRNCLISCAPAHSETTLTIPNTIEVIGDYAISGCMNLTTIHLPETISSIGSKGIRDCSDLRDIYCYAVNPPAASSDMFADLPTDLKIYVPNSALNAYKEADGWRYYSDRIFADPSTLTNNKIYYTSTDSKIVTPYSSSAFNGNITSNTYSNGSGVITFDTDITTFGVEAFKNCTTLKTIQIPNGVETIGTKAFYGCTALQNVSIPSSVITIDNSAFYGCSSLTSIAIPESVTSIGTSAFISCTNLTRLDITSLEAWCNIVLNETSSNPLYKSGGDIYLNGVLLTDVVIPQSITEIKYATFYKAKAITSVTLSNNTTTIGSYAFYGCSSLTSVTIPNGVTSIGSYAFYGCSSLTSIAIPESVTSIDTSAFSSCTNLTRVDITSLEAWCNIAFGGTLSNPLYASGGDIYLNGVLLTDVVIPQSVTEVKFAAFYNARSITSVTLSNNTTTIGSYAFRYCTALTSVIIPESVTSIGNYCFNGCTALTNVYCKPTTPPTLGGTYTFGNNATDRKIYVPAAAVDAYKSATNWSEYASAIEADNSIPNNEIWYTSTDGNIVTPYDAMDFGANIVSNTYSNGKGVITFDGKVTKIGDYAFYQYGNPTLSSLRMPDSVTAIGYYSFSNCENLTSITLSNSLTYIGYAFSYSGITEITIPDSVTYVADHLFSFCDDLKAIYGKFASTDNRCLVVDGVLNSFAPSGLTSYSIPSGITTIGNYAFYDCKNLTSVTIPSSVTAIGHSAFGYTSLSSVTLPSNLQSIGEDAFRYCNITTINIPSSVTTIEGNPFAYCTKLATFSGQYATSDNNALIYNNILTSVASDVTQYTVPEAVKTLGVSSFSNCKSLTSVTIPANVTEIRSHGFSNCPNLAAVHCLSTTPPTANKQNWDAWHCFDNNASGRKIYVPAESVSAYKSAENWSTYADDIVAEATTEMCQILYTSTDGNIITPSSTAAFGAANIVSNTYENGQGVITFDSLVTTIGTSAFSGCTTLSSITIPEGVTSIGGSAFQNCTSLPSITIPVGITSISSAFSGCINLKSVYIDDLSAYCKISFSSISSVPTYNSAKLYVKGTELTKLTIPEDVTTIKYATFYKCSSIKSVVIGNHVTSIENYTFRYCPAITSVKIGNGVTTIGNYAFANCTALESVTIGSGATKIGSGAFLTCSKLAVVRCKPTTPPTLSSSNTFDSNATDRVIYVPQAAVEAYQSATNWSEYASAIVADDNQVTPGDDINENQYPDEL